MARLLYGGEPVLNITNGNFVLAHLQYATYERFRQRDGYFITFFGGTDDEGRVMPLSCLWCDPTIPLRFIFDEAEEPVMISRELVDSYLAAMNDPFGVLIGPTGLDFRPPFTLLDTEREGGVG